MSPSGKKMAIWTLISINSVIFSCDYNGAVLSPVFVLYTVMFDANVPGKM
jgi:hypothetical protein